MRGATDKGAGDGDNLESGGHRRDLSNFLHQNFSGVTVKITALLVVMGAVTCLLLFQSSYPLEFFNKSFSCPDSKTHTPSSSSNKAGQSISPTSSSHQNTLQNLPPSVHENDEIEKTLRKAVMKDNKTVIFTTINAAWTEPNSIFDLFLESFQIGNGTQLLLKHVVVGAFDQTAYNRCLAKGLHCLAITTDGVNFSGEAFYMSDHYLKMMWRRTGFLCTILELGYDFVFTDSDVMWLRNPFDRFYPDGDLQIASDHYSFNYTDVRNWPNGGFIYVKSNIRTISFYKYWYGGRKYFPGENEQDVLNHIKTYPYISKIGLKLQFLDTTYFSGFCEPSKNLDLIITMHANCRTRLGIKIHDIKIVIGIWKRYISLPPDQRNSKITSWKFRG